MRLLVPVLVLTSSLACKKLDPPPEGLGELTLYLVAHFDDEDSEALAVGTLELEGHAAGVDLTGDLNARASTNIPLPAESLGGIDPVPAFWDPSVQLPVLMWGESIHGIQPNIDLVGEDNYVCIGSDSTVYSHREFDENLDCFLAGECDRVNTTSEIRKETFLADIWYDQYTDYRRFELEDGRVAMVSRGWIPDKYLADNENRSWDQLLLLDIWVEGAEDPAKTLRFSNLWSSVTIPGVGDDVYVNVVKSGMDEGFQRADQFISGEECDNDRDREYDRPQE